MRLFTAIKIDEIFKGFLTQFKTQNKELAGLKWIKPKNMHITTCFIGEFPSDKIGKLILNLKEIGERQQSFFLEFDRIDFSPGKKPYMIWAYFKPNEKFTLLCNLIADAAQTPIPKRTNPIPHLTIARLKKPHYQYRLNADIGLLNLKIPVKEISLFQSVQTGRGSDYYIVENLNFAE